MEISVGYLKFVNLKIKSSNIHKVRGYFGREYIDYDILHNHFPESDKQKFFYRYPKIQFKLINKHLSILAIETDALETIYKIFIDELPKFTLERQTILELSKEISLKNVVIGVSDTDFVYKFISPWIALNQKNYKDYLKLTTESAKEEKLNSILIQNIISFCKGINYTIPREHRLIVSSDLKPKEVILKGKKVLGFLGNFKINFKLINYMGIGKSSSRGYGVITKIL